MSHKPPPFGVGVGVGVLDGEGVADGEEIPPLVEGVVFGVDEALPGTEGEASGVGDGVEVGRRMMRSTRTCFLPLAAVA